MCFEAGTVAGKGFKTLARASEVMVEWGCGVCLAANGSVVWVVAVCVGVGMCFCTVPVDEQDLDVTIKWSR